MWRESFPSATPDAFEKRVNRTLDQTGFAAQVRAICKPAYAEAAKGGRPGIDSSIIDANASLRGLEHRNTEESYWQYVKRLATEAGVDPQDTKAVRRFDKKRAGRKTSNDDWQNCLGTPACVPRPSGCGQNASGPRRFSYKPEHISDLESGAIIHAEVRAGDAADNDATLKARLMKGRATLKKVLPKKERAKAMSEVCADEGYFATEQIASLLQAGVRTITGATIVQSGVLQVGALGVGTTGTGTVTAQSNSTMIGTGVIQGSSFTASSGSTIHASDGIAQANYGTLTFAPVSGFGAIDFQSGSTLILGIAPDGTSDLLYFVGTGSNSLSFNENLTVGPAIFIPVAEKVFNLLDWSGLFASPTFAARFDYTGWLYGNGDEATGLDLPDVSASSYYWDISQFTTQGPIALVMVPEPSRTGLLGAYLLLTLLRRNRTHLIRSNAQKASFLRELGSKLAR